MFNVQRSINEHPVTKTDVIEYFPAFNIILTFSLGFLFYLTKKKTICAS